MLAANVVHAAALEPFVASYQVYRNGKPVGDATMQVVKQVAGNGGGARWRIDLGIRGTRGLAGLAGINIEQSTLFDVEGTQYRPLSQSTVRRALFGGKKNVGVYDWNANTARWQGDVKETRRGAIPLQAGDMSGLLINLAIIRDAQPGKALHYRFVDDGRLREHDYVVAHAPESMVVDELSYNAMRVNRVQSGAEETILWVASGVPTPIRILQRENGQDSLDLRLIEYKGVN
ncbi:MAG: DUF3108 domain-containing protein [Pseudomonadota bacterium]|nr:DUF3108 domain-containing protein [Pseudomonadota bacterium]